MTIYRMEARCYGFDAKPMDSPSKCSHGLMCNLRCGLGYCFRVNSMTALYCTFLNLSIKHELHYLQLNSMANAKSNIIYTRPYNIIKLKCPFVCVCVCLYPGIIRAQNKLTHPTPGAMLGGYKFKKSPGNVMNCSENQ